MQPFCLTLCWQTRAGLLSKDCLMFRQFNFNKYKFTSRKPAPLNDQNLSTPFSEPYLSPYRCWTTNMATQTHHPSMDPVSFYLFSWGPCCLSWKSWCAGIAEEMSDPYSWTTMRKSGKINMGVLDLTFPKTLWVALYSELAYDSYMYIIFHDWKPTFSTVERFLFPIFPVGVCVFFGFFGHLCAAETNYYKLN